VIESKRDKIWGGRVLAFSSLSKLIGCREAGGAFSLSADWEELTVVWLDTPPACAAAFACEGPARWGEGGGCEVVIYNLKSS
jgi:hypothetical protein